MSSRQGQKKATGSKSNPLDANKVTEYDPRDPRSVGCWPCFGVHKPSAQRSNQAGAWVECEFCALRLEYYPRMGNSGQFAQTWQPAVVKMAMKELQKVVGQDGFPTEKQAKAAIQLVNARLKLEAKPSKLEAKPSKGKEEETPALKWKETGMQARQKERPKTLRGAKRKQSSPASSESWTEVSEMQTLTPQEETDLWMDLFGDSDSPTEAATDRAAQEAALVSRS